MPCPSCFKPRIERPITHCTGGCVGPGLVWIGAKNLLPTGIQVLTQPIASRYTSYTMLAHISFCRQDIRIIWFFMYLQLKILIIHGVAVKCSYHDTKYSLEAKLPGVWMYQSFRCDLSSNGLLLFTLAVVFLWHPLSYFYSSVCPFHKHITWTHNGDIVLVHLSACFLSETWIWILTRFAIGGAYTKLFQADLIMIGQLQNDKEWSYFWG